MTGHGYFDDTEPETLKGGLMLGLYGLLLLS
jgi:hypothetical protein